MARNSHGACNSHGENGGGIYSLLGAAIPIGKTRGKAPQILPMAITAPEASPPSFRVFPQPIKGVGSMTILSRNSHTDSTGSEILVDLAVDRISPNPRQPRRHFTPEQIDGLASSIRSQGIIQPLVVRPSPDSADQYQLVTGERRLRAVRHLGWKTVPVVVRQIPDEALLETSLVENLQREQLSPIEEALAYRTLLDGYGYTQETLAPRVGKDRSTLANMVRLLALPVSLQEDLESGRLSVGHARALLAVEEMDRQFALRDLVVKRRLSVRETERLVQLEQQRRSSRPDDPSKPETPDAEALNFEAARNSLERQLGTRVAIQQGPDGQGGRIEIEYYDMDDFNRLYDLFLRS